MTGPVCSGTGGPLCSGISGRMPPEYALCLILLLIPTITGAESTISCHCFQDRTFNHRDTAAADPYFLATTQNSFISLIYGVDKRSLVKAKMSGTSGTQLWILQDIAEISQKSLSEVEDIYSISKNWLEVFKTLKLSSQQLTAQYLQLGNNPEQLADYIVDRQLIIQFSVSETDLQKWRKLGMVRKELILAILLKGDPADLYDQINSRIQTWGQLLYNQGLVDGHAISQQLKNRMRSPKV